MAAQPPAPMPRRTPLLLLALFLVAVGAGVFGISRLSYNVDLFDLLPKHLPGLNGTRLMRDAFQQKDRLVITLENADAGRLHSAAESLAAFLRARPELCVKVKSGQTALEDPDFLAGLAAFTWLNAPPEEVSALAASLEPQALEKNLAATLEELATSTDGQAMALGAYDPLGLGAKSVSIFQGSLQGSPAGDGFRSPDGTFQLIFAEPPGELGDYRDAGAWLARMRDAVKVWRAGTAMGKAESEKGEGTGGEGQGDFHDVAFGFTGEPAFRAEISAGMESDMKQSIGLITFIVGGLFWLMHRTVKPLLLLMLALLVTNLLTIGLAGVFFGSLNVMSIGFAAILTGMVEDFGVVGLHEAQTLKNPTWAEVARRVAPGVFWSAVTAAAVFGSLALSSLPGISQLGLITAIGILTGALVMVCAFLPLALKLKSPPPHEPKPLSASGRFSALPGWSALVLTVACVAILIVRGFPGLTSETAVLRPVGSEAYSAMERLQEKMQPGGRDGGWIPLVASGSPAQVHEALRQAAEILGKSGSETDKAGPWFLPGPLFPCEACQAANLPLLRAIAARQEAIGQAVEAAGFERDAFLFTGKILTLWQQWAATSPAASSVASGPTLRWPDTSLLEGPAGGMITRTGEGEKASSVAMGFVTLPPGQTAENAPILKALAQVPHLEPVGWEVLSAGMKSLAGAEVTRICVPAVIGLAVLLWLAFRSFREIALALLTLAFSGLVLVACMAAGGMEWNMVNIAAVPLSLGLGLDFAIHMIYSLRRLPADGGDGGRGTGRALLYCGLSTGLGFGSLALSGNKGLISMGICCTIGVLATLVTAAVLLPWAWRQWPVRGS